MTMNFIAYGIFAYFIGLIFSCCIAMFSGQWKKSNQLFIISNALGFIIGVLYLFNFASGQIGLANWGWFFHFSPAINLLSGIFFTFISGVSVAVGVYSMRYLQLYEDTYSPVLVQSLMTIFVLGMQGVLFANNAFVFLFFWEIMSVASFFLVMVDRTQESVRAAFLYFIMTHLGAMAILGGFLILGNGSLIFDFSGIADASQNLSPALVALSFTLFLFGFGSKAGLVPFHVWLPEAHPQAPSNISALMSGLMLKVAVYGFIKIVFSIVGLPYWAGLVVIILGILSALVGVLYSVIERDMKRAFAYSSIENMGIIFTMLGLALYLFAQNAGNAVADTAVAIVAFALFHAASHALFKTALFLSSGVIINRVHSKSLEVMGGIAKLMPVFSFAFLLAILASLPLPPFSTFYGELGLIQNIINLFHSTKIGSNVLIVLVITLSLVGLVGGLAIFAMVKIFGISMLGLGRSHHMETRDEKTDYAMTVPILILSAGVLVLGIIAKPVLSWLIDNIGAKESTAVSAGIRLPSMSVFFAFAILLGLTYVLRSLFIKNKLEREYKTWDCGQPINSTMEYTATAFSAPIRFFFLKFLGSEKFLKSTPVVETNPWIRRYSFSLLLHSVWQEKLYEPTAKILKVIANRVKVIQSGRIQYYLLFLLATLIITLIIVL